MVLWSTIMAPLGLAKPHYIMGGTISPAPWEFPCNLLIDMILATEGQNKVGLLTSHKLVLMELIPVMRSSMSTARRNDHMEIHRLTCISPSKAPVINSSILSEVYPWGWFC